MNVMKFFFKFMLLTIVLISVSAVSHAHSYSLKEDVKYQARIKLTPIERVESKLLPRALYMRTMGHTFKRKFAFQNQEIKHVYYNASQPKYKLYATVVPKSFVNRASSYWP